MINSNLRTFDDPKRMHKIEKSGLVAHAVELVATARQAGIPIFWIQVERRADRADVSSVKTDLLHRRVSVPKPPTLAGSFEAQNVDELPVLEDDQVVLKPRMDPFTGTPLDLWLRSRAINTIILGGYATNGGVESAMRTAADLNYDVIIARDCCYNVEEDAHEFTLTSVMPFYSRIRTNEQIKSMIR
jgi:nicotinamidase-related amidase